MDQKVEFWNHARMYEPSRPQDDESSNQTIYALQRIVHHEIVFEIEIYVIITQIIQTRAILQVKVLILRLSVVHKPYTFLICSQMGPM